MLGDMTVCHLNLEGDDKKNRGVCISNAGAPLLKRVPSIKLNVKI